MYLSPENLPIARYLALSLSIISLFSCLFFIAFYLYTRKSKKFYLQLVLYLQTSDAILAFGLLLSFFSVKENEDLCHVQAFLVQFGAISSILWRSSISVIMYISILKGADSAELQEIKMMMVIFWLSILFSVIPFCNKNYGYYEIWCWLAVDSTPVHIYLIVFYIELWVSMVIIAIITILVRERLKLEICKSSLSNFNKRIKYYPFALIILWFFPSIEFLLMFSYQKTAAEQVFSYTTAIAFGFQGCINFFLYGYGYIRKFISKKLKRDSSQKDLYSVGYYNQQDQSFGYTKLLLRELDNKNNNNNNGNNNGNNNNNDDASDTSPMYSEIYTED